MIGGEGGSDGLDDEFFSHRGVGVGATIMGRNMFGPIRGPWGTNEWIGWWGEHPPFHHPVFVLTHHPRPPIELEGGTTFYFVDGGIDAALGAAFEVAGDRDVLVGGGAATVRQYLGAGLIDELHLAIVPVLLGSGGRLFDGSGPSADDYRCVEHGARRPSPTSASYGTVVNDGLWSLSPPRRQWPGSRGFGRPLPARRRVTLQARLAVLVTKSTAQMALSFGTSLASQLDPKRASSIQGQTVKWS